MSEYKQCSYCVMDTSDEDILFDEAGRCNHCKSYFSKVNSQLVSDHDREEKLDSLVKQIKSSNTTDNTIVLLEWWRS